ncbi:hypothetical protein KC711_04135 [Candidatus Peregrinibacteria bacterium]|nr:hypothetical protein [Candidatus Peregrinibacteria bacterium]MCB9804876.1 hypothetical protein [Candidatus Peribacteria bacterium]
MGASSPVKAVMVSCVIPVEEFVSQEDVSLPDDIFSDTTPVDEFVPDHVSVSDEITSDMLPDDITPEPEISPDSDDVKAQE